jgi:TonB family protein
MRIALVALSMLLIGMSLAQNTTLPERKDFNVILEELSPPVYPPLARQARIRGDVVVKMGIRKDGSVASQQVIDGHPILKPAAIASIQKSRFVCSGCSEDVTSYSLTYTFSLRENRDCGVTRPRSIKCAYLWKCGDKHYNESRKSEIIQSNSQITIIADALCVETQYSHGR